MNSIIVVLIIAVWAQVHQGAFVHPGVMVNKAQLDWIKLQVQQKIEPVWSAYVNANKTTIASPSYKPRGPPATGVIECGFYSSPDYGCTDDSYDSSAAYAQALLFYITGNKVYANNAIAIINKYAYNLTLINSTFNGPLQAGWSTAKFLKGAEILRHTDSGLEIYELFDDNGYPGSGANGNWELTMLDGLLGIAILSDNQTLFNHTIGMWRQRVPSYFYNYNLDGNKYVPPPRGYPTWYGNIVFNQSTSGLCQETCRDLAHTQMGLNSAINCAETAYIQGFDLYSEQQERMTTALEFHAGILLNYTHPAYLCNYTALVSTTSYTATFETAYSAYASRNGVPLNKTLTHILTHVRKITSQFNLLTNVFETLTSSSLAPAFFTTSASSTTSTVGHTSSTATVASTTTTKAASTTTTKAASTTTTKAASTSTSGHTSSTAAVTSSAASSSTTGARVTTTAASSSITTGAKVSTTSTPSPQATTTTKAVGSSTGPTVAPLVGSSAVKIGISLVLIIVLVNL